MQIGQGKGTNQITRNSDGSVLEHGPDGQMTQLRAAQPEESGSLMIQESEEQRTQRRIQELEKITSSLVERVKQLEGKKK